jgi:hypothetical protein
MDSELSSILRYHLRYGVDPLDLPMYLVDNSRYDPDFWSDLGKNKDGREKIPSTSK